MSKVILITGGSTGLGAATALCLSQGNDIIVHYNQSEEAAINVADKIKRNGGNSILIKADLTTEEACINLIKKVKKQFKKIDVLVNNAGGMIKRQLAAELQWAHMLDTFSLNTFSTMKLSSLCIPLLETAEDPCIINITSIAVRHGAPTATIYGACKGAIDSFTRGLANELAPKIRVNAIAPGVIDTPFHDKVSTPERIRQVKESTPLKKIGNANHIALTIEFLINNNHITGETIDINGGLYMH